MAAPGTWFACIAATRASVTARNSGEASASRVLGIGSGAIAAAPATGVPDVAVATGEATGVTWADGVAHRRCGSRQRRRPASERTRRRENRAGLTWKRSINDSFAVVPRSAQSHKDSEPILSFLLRSPALGSPRPAHRAGYRVPSGCGGGWAVRVLRGTLQVRISSQPICSKRLGLPPTPVYGTGVASISTGSYR